MDQVRWTHKADDIFARGFAWITWLRCEIVKSERKTVCFDGEPHGVEFKPCWGFWGFKSLSYLNTGRDLRTRPGQCKAGGPMEAVWSVSIMLVLSNQDWSCKECEVTKSVGLNPFPMAGLAHLNRRPLTTKYLSGLTATPRGMCWFSQIITDHYWLPWKGQL